MSIQRPRRIDRRTAEHLLAGAPMGAHAGHPPLAALLTAAAAPGRPDELAREQATMAAFRSAQLAPAPRPRRLSTVRSVAMKVLTVKAAVALAATTAGGVALAASSGALPNPLAQRPPATSGLSAAQPAATQSLASREADDHSSSQGSQAAKRPDSSHAPSPSLAGLCQAYRAGNKDKSEKAGNGIGGTNNATSDSAANDNAKSDKAKSDKVLDNPAFSVLVTAAGGKDKVERFCLSLMATPTPSSSTTQRSGRSDDGRGGQHGGNRDGTHTDSPQ